MPPVWIVLLLLPILGGAERFNCRGRILGAYYADAKSGCKAFHVCVRVAGGGVRDFRFFCPPGTLFHQEAQTCTDWGDDDPLACPADLYDGQFDLYKIGSGYDTKKVSSSSNRDEENEFSLQRAETGDRRLSQNQNSVNNGPASDLRTAHSSDFFSGQRDRGRDEPVPQQRQPSRQSFRRPTTRPTPAVQYTTQPPTSPSQPSSPPQYETSSKRKLVRKRPIYVSSTASPITTQRPQPQQFSQQPYTQPPQPQQNYQRIQQQKQSTPPPANVPPQYKDEYVEVVRVAPKQTPNRYYPNNPTSTQVAPTTFLPQFNKKEGLTELYNYEAQSTPGFSDQNDRHSFKVRNSFNVANNYRGDFSRSNYNTNPGRGSPATTDYTTTREFVSSTPTENKNSFNVANNYRGDFARSNYNPNPGRGSPTTTDFTTTREFVPSTSTANKNFNSYSSEFEKNKYESFRESKQNYFKTPTSTIPTTTFYTTSRSERPSNLNTVAYNTNIALNTIQPFNNINREEDDGQYRPPQGEDDGQYRPELYERELLSGAHSLNIAASGNRLPEDQQKSKSKSNFKSSQSAAPRPFRPAPTVAVATTTSTAEPSYTTTYRVPTTTYRAPTTTYKEPTTTYRAPSTTLLNTQRTFDYFQTYTTTAKPFTEAVQTYNNYSPVNSAPSRAPSAAIPSGEPARGPARAPQPPTVPPPRPTTRSPNFSKPASNKEDNSYDYAYYDTDPGYSEYDNIEEFGKTKTRA